MERMTTILWKAVLCCAVVVIMIILGESAKATTYSFTESGEWGNKNIWSPSYPGTMVGEGDSIIVAKHVKLNKDLIIKGTLVIEKNASLMGSGNVVILNSGNLVNNGITIAKDLTNRGRIENYHILESSIDFINTGRVENFQSLVVGNIMDNIGDVTGDGGKFIANKKLINSNSGFLAGNIDVCSDNFMNIQGGALDSVNVSFCGNRIFNGMFLMASLHENYIEIDLKNAADREYQQYALERSRDGVAFETVALYTHSEISKNSNKIVDENRPADVQTLYYRVKLSDEEGNEMLLPTVRVGTVFGKSVNTRK